MHTTLLRSTLALALLSAAVPVAAQNREHQQMSAELRMLQQQTQELALTLAQLGEALKAINSRMDAADAAAQKRFADQELLIKNLGADLKAVRERTQDTDTQLRKLADEVDALRSTITSLPSLLSSAPAPPPTETSALDPNAPVPVAGVPPAAGSTPPSTVGLFPGRMLNTAKSDYFAGAYTSAITGFEQLLKMFPQTEAAAEAQFLLGETYYQLKRWQDASNAYSVAIQNYPRSSQVPESYYKRGKAQESLAQLDLARASYEQLIKTYPDTPSAGLAKQALDRLGRQTPAPARP
jgi:tol-pal system protein YbgF